PCKWLGCGAANLAPAEGSSISKGESLADTVRVVAGYSDALNIRHPKEGSARLAPKPIPKSFPSLPQQILIYASSSRYS
ncbi:MAG: aspartate carbamoyltransferase catalytic subunit, partial [Methanosaeta sp. ASO1]